MIETVKVTNLVFDEFFEYEGYNGCDSVCAVKIWETQPATDSGPYVVMLTELPDNPGPSVTNSCEHIATLLLATLGHFAGPHAIWIEHYPGLEESWSVIRFEYNGHCFSRPQWRHLSREDAILMGVA